MKHLHPFGVNHPHFVTLSHTPQNHLQNWCCFFLQKQHASYFPPFFCIPTGVWRPKSLPATAGVFASINLGVIGSSIWRFLVSSKRNRWALSKTTFFMRFVFLLMICFSLWVEWCYMNLHSYDLLRLGIFSQGLHHSLSFKVEIHGSSVILWWSENREFHSWLLCSLHCLKRVV